MTKDERESRSPISGDVLFASGDSGSSKDLITIRGEQNMSLNDYVISYDTNGTATATVEMYDDEEGTSAGNLSGSVETVVVDPGDVIVVSDIARSDIQNDLVIVVNNNDGDVSVTAGAYLVAG